MIFRLFLENEFEDEARKFVAEFDDEDKIYEEVRLLEKKLEPHLKYTKILENTVSDDMYEYFFAAIENEDYVPDFYIPDHIEFGEDKDYE